MGSFPPQALAGGPGGERGPWGQRRYEAFLEVAARLPSIRPVTQALAGPVTVPRLCIATTPVPAPQP